MNKIEEIIHNDLIGVETSLNKIRAVAGSSWHYLDDSFSGQRSKEEGDALYILEAIEDLSKAAIDNVTKAMDKLYKISQ